MSDKHLSREQVIAEHERLADCWTNRCGRPDWGSNHAARAVAVRNGAELTDHEKAGNDYGMMYDVLAGAPDEPENISTPRPTDCAAIQDGSVGVLARDMRGDAAMTTVRTA